MRHVGSKIIHLIILILLILKMNQRKMGTIDFVAFKKMLKLKLLTDIVNGRGRTKTNGRYYPSGSGKKFEILHLGQ